MTYRANENSITKLILEKWPNSYRKYGNTALKMHSTSFSSFYDVYESKESYYNKEYPIARVYFDNRIKDNVLKECKK